MTLLAWRSPPLHRGIQLEPVHCDTLIYHTFDKRATCDYDGLLSLLFSAEGRRSEGEEKLRRRTIVTTENYVVLSYACAFISRNVDVAMLSDYERQQ